MTQSAVLGEKSDTTASLNIYGKSVEPLPVNSTAGRQTGIITPELKFYTMKRGVRLLGIAALGGASKIPGMEWIAHAAQLAERLGTSF